MFFAKSFDPFPEYKRAPYYPRVKVKKELSVRMTPLALQ